MKLCNECKQFRPVESFYHDKYTKDGFTTTCKECNYIREKKSKEKNPWYKHLKSTRQRCNDKNASNYKWYGAKGIKCLLTIEDIKYLWNRDKTWLFKEAHLSRNIHDESYYLDNCYFSSKKENITESNKRTKTKVKK